MIVVMESDAGEQAVERVIAFLVSGGFDVHRSSGQSRTILGVVGEASQDDIAVVRELEGVSEVVQVSEPFRLASRRFRREPTIVEGPWGTIGGAAPWIAIEPVGDGADVRSAEAEMIGVNEADAPYRLVSGRPFDAAVWRGRAVPEHVGSLTCVSLHPRPAERRLAIAFVERSPSWGAAAWIDAAERELERQEAKVVLLEAGGEYPSGARTLEIAAIARAKQRTHLPIVVDVPTIAQRARYCEAVAGAAIGAGVDGVILRVWVGEEGVQPRVPATLGWSEGVRLAERLRKIASVVRQ